MTLGELSRFYRNLAELEHSGISPLQAFETFKRGERRSERAMKYEYVIQQIKKGRSLSQSLAFVKMIPVFDVPLVKAAEDSGRLVETFKVLAKRYGDLQSAIRQIRSQLLKPFITLVVALFVPSLPALFSGELSLWDYLIRSFGGLFVIISLIYVLNDLWIRSYFDYEKARQLQSILRHLPFFSSFSSKSAIQRFVSTLAMMLEAGIDAFTSLQQAAKASVRDEIVSAVHRMLPKLKDGGSMPALFMSESVFPEDLSSAILLGQESGKLPEFLKRYASGLEAQIQEKLQAFIKIFPVVVYLIIAAYVAFLIISIYLGQFSLLSKGI